MLRGAVLDQGLALFFQGPHSFTGEDVLELQGHGGPVIVQLLIKELLHLGARLARPGEFSERAFLNGKIDLAQAEAIADLIHASTEQAARAASRSLQGEFSDKVRTLTQAVIELRIYIEAAIDFAEEEIDFLGDLALLQRFKQTEFELEALLQGAKQGSLLRDGLHVVLAGKPNVGKSTLLNILSGKESAIVTELPGTTRDILREQIQIEGLALHLSDTAGLRETQDRIELEGIKRAQQEIASADLLLQVIEAADSLDSLSISKTQPTLIIRNKIDLLKETPAVSQFKGHTVISLSAKENQGLKLLHEAIKAVAGFSEQSEGTFSARGRHLFALQKAQVAFKAAYLQVQSSRAGELIAEDLRQMQKQLNIILGEFSNEDLLGRIFSSFCIGK